MWVRVCSAGNKYTYPVALTVIHCRINLYLEVALSGIVSGMIQNHNRSALSIHVSNVYDRRRLFCVIIAQLMHIHCMVVECKCPDWRKQLQARSKYSRRRVWSPLVDQTAQHKNVCVGYRTAAPDSVDCHRRVTAGQFKRRTIHVRIVTYYLLVSHYKGQNSDAHLVGLVSPIRLWTNEYAQGLNKLGWRLVRLEF